MLTKFRRWLFRADALFTLPFAVSQLGRFATVSGPFWVARKQLLLDAGYVVIGRSDYSFDRVEIALQGWPAKVGKVVLTLERVWRYRGYALDVLYRMGFLATPEFERYSFRHHFRLAFWRTLRERKAPYRL